MDLADRLKSALKDKEEAGWQVDTLCEKCGFNRSECVCQSKTYLTPGEHRLYIRREKRKGKILTLAGPFAIEADALAPLLKKLKTRLAAGGSIEEDFLLFQGECETRLRALLKEEGFGFKRG